MTRRVLLLIAALLVVSIGPRAQEVVTLTTPIAKPSTSTCQLDELHLYPAVVFATSRIVVQVRCNNGDLISKQYDQFTTPTGASLLTTLNRSNNSVGNPSFIAKIYTRLVADGVIVGTVSGAVQ